MLRARRFFDLRTLKLARCFLIPLAKVRRYSYIDWKRFPNMKDKISTTKKGTHFEDALNHKYNKVELVVSTTVIIRR